MKILFLANDAHGLYNFRLELLQKLIKSNEVFIALPYDDIISEFQALGCRFFETPIDRRATNPITDLKLLLNYKSIIKKVKPDVVLTYTIKPNVYGGFICRILRIPYLTTITGLGSAIENEGFLKKIALLLYKISLKNSSCIFFQNEDNQKVFRDKKIMVGPNRLIPGSGVNLQHYQLLEYPTDETINFVCIGRLMREKGIEHYFDTAEYVRRNYPDTVFHLIGDYEEDYENRIKELKERDIIQFHGRQKDVRTFHRISNCTIHPSYLEGMSNVLLESAACGRPIIATNIGGCKEIVDDGVNGFLVEKKQSQDLINKVEQFLALSHEEKKQMGLSSRKKVENGFDRQIVINAYLDEIDKTQES